MKKLICLLLAIILLCPMLISCEEKDEETKMKDNFLFTFGGKGKSSEDVIIEFDAGTYNGARVVMLDAHKHKKEKRVIELTEDAVITYYDTNILYAYKNGFFFPLNIALTFGILTEEDVKDIAYKYRESITTYTDVCDKHDFDTCEVDFKHYQPKDSNLSSNILLIKIDKTILFGGKMEEKQLLTDYINSHFDSDIVQKIGLHVREEADNVTFKVFVEDKGIDGLPEIMQKLASVPGLLKIECYSRTHNPQI
jgi:hypothetical protein